MKYSLILLGCSTALVTFLQPAIAKTPAEIEAIARSVSVEIKVKGSDRVGSGVIVHRQGDLYTLVTNRHVACGSQNCNLKGQSYTLVTADKQQYQVSVKGVKLVEGDLDLAIFQFRSSRKYTVAQVAEPGSLKVDDAVYTAGFPTGKDFAFGQGEAQAVVNKRLKGDGGGYTMIYNAETLPGMSGGGAFDREGRLVAIHGYGDRFTENTEADSNYYKRELGNKIGINRGIPVRWLVQGLGEKGIDLGKRSLLRSVHEGAEAAAATADEFFIAGFNKLVEPGDNVQAGRLEAVKQFSRAIKVNQKYTSAYFMRAYVNELLGNYSQTLADYNQAIFLNPKLTDSYNNRGNLKKDRLNDFSGALADYNQAISLNPKYANAYINRGNLKADKLSDFPGALADYNQTISLNPKSTEAYYNRGLLKADKLNDFPGALADYNQAISLNPKFAFAYTNRGLLKADKLNDFPGALADYNQALSLNPKSANAYYNRGLLKENKLNDFSGALADYNQAISLNPKDADAYINRGLLKENKLNDFPGALADYNQALSLNPKFAEAYNNRGLLKYEKLNDRAGGIADLRIAEKLYRSQGNIAKAQQIVNGLRQLGITE